MLALDEQLVAMRKQEADVTRAIKLEQQRVRRQNAPPQHVAKLLHCAGLGNFKPKVSKDWAVALLLLLELAGFCTEVVVSYALGQGRDCRSMDSDFEVHDQGVRSVIAAGVELLFLGVPLNIMVTALDTSGQQVYSFSRYVVEYHLFHWLIHQNCNKGVAPSHAQLLMAAAGFVKKVLCPGCISERLNAFFVDGGRAARMWACRFKHKWGVRTGALKVGEDMGQSLLEAKAPWCIRFY